MAAGIEERQGRQDLPNSTKYSHLLEYCGIMTKKDIIDQTCRFEHVTWDGFWNQRSPTAPRTHPAKLSARTYRGKNIIISQ